MEAPSLAAFKNLVNLAGQDLGTQVVFANDDFLLKRKISSNLKSLSFYPMSTPSGANGWMVGSPAVSAS